MKLIINTGNAAFEDGYKELEAARIIAEAAKKVEQGQYDQKLYDVNGNHVGNLVNDDSTLTFAGEKGGVVVQFDTGNAAFEDGQFEYEAARVLTEAADRIRDGALSFNLRDINGNTIGKVSEWAEPAAELPKSLGQAHRAKSSDSDNNFEY